MRGWVALALGTVIACAARGASAQAPSPTELKMAQDLVEEGRALGQQGRWGDALARFQRARELSHKVTPQLEFYIGYAEGRAGKLVAADVDLRRAIELARAAGNEQVARAAQAELPELEARTPSVVIAVSGGAQAAGLQIDGETIGVAALGSPIPLDPGTHSVVVRFASGSVTKQVDLAERQHATVPVEAPPPGASAAAGQPSAPAPASAPASPAAAAPAHEQPGTSGRGVLGLVVTGVGGAALVAGGVFYLLARSAIGPVTSACPSSPCSIPNGSPLPGDYQDAQQKQTTAIVLAIAGGAVAATGLVLFATAPSGGEAQPATAVRLAPWIAMGAGGASVSGSFR